MPNLSGPDGALRWIRKNVERYNRDGVGKWAMLLKSTGDLIGYAGLARIDVEGAAETEVGYAVAPQHRGQGFALEASQSCISYAFDKLRLTRVVSLIRPENLPSRRVAERNGMLVERHVVDEGLPYLVYVSSRLSTFLRDSIARTRRNGR